LITLGIELHRFDPLRKKRIDANGTDPTRFSECAQTVIADAFPLKLGELPLEEPWRVQSVQYEQFCTATFVSPA
jgi:hypothetical protein